MHARTHTRAYTHTQ
ncbi:hypothetical protein NP493_242g03089 [Ridgeia piscesae]|uniref:Uncharacterized protein n=1 Tax=Ridgeia piscesae TaxID=27915 RepID=A0AAD9NYU7_RIDPI|nr:hypothetical protein NP493_242g03089 [Ridgeia piscesae]